MTSLVALVSGFGWHVADLQRAAERLGVLLHAEPFPNVSAAVGLDQTGPKKHARIGAGGLDLTVADGVLVRMMPPGSLEQVVFRMDALNRLAALGVPVLNPPRAVEAAVDKYLTLALLDAAGIPVPPTWAGESADEALAGLRRAGGRRRGQAAVWLRGTGPGPHQRQGTGLENLSRDRAVGWRPLSSTGCAASWPRSPGLRSSRLGPRDHAAPRSPR